MRARRNSLLAFLALSVLATPVMAQMGTDMIAADDDSTTTTSDPTDAAPIDDMPAPEPEADPGATTSVPSGERTDPGVVDPGGEPPSAGDTNGPRITDFDPPRRLSAGDSVVFTWRLRDPAGVQNTSVAVGWASGIYTPCGFGESAELVSGTIFDGQWRLECTFPETAPATTYSVQVVASNNLGVVSFSGWSDLLLDGANSDSSPPTYSDVRSDGAGRAGETVTIRWNAVDASAIEGAIMWLAGPDGYRFAGADGRPYADYSEPVNRNCNGGRTSCSFTQVARLADGAPAGTWTLWISAVDIHGNKVLEQAGTLVVRGA